MGGNFGFTRFPTLCWDCAKAVRGCDWSREFKPVEGWTAILREIPVNGEPIVSFVVQKCPEFKRDGTKGGTIRWHPGDELVRPHVYTDKGKKDVMR